MRNLCNIVVLVLYGASWCHYCTLQVNELNKLHIEFKYVDVDTVTEKMKSIPTLVNDKGDIHHGLLTGEALKEFVS